jgi:hypothetical protein
LENDESWDSDIRSEDHLERLPHPLETWGRLPIYRASLPCVVIGENWPAWLPILPSLGAKAVAVVCASGRLEVQGWADEGVPRLVVGSSAAGKFLGELERDTLVFVTGSTMFVKSLAEVLRNMTRLVFALDVGNRVTPVITTLYPEVNWTRIAHSEVGGVTSAKNWFGASAGLGRGDMVEATYRRTIGEVLQPTLLGRFGKPMAPPSQKPLSDALDETRVLFEGSNLVLPNGLWPAQYGKLQIVAPSVFSNMGWVWRELDPTELGAAWDLPVAVIKTLKRVDGGKDSQTCEINKVC